MKVINLPNRETFRTNNEEAGEFIEKIVRGGEHKVWRRCFQQSIY